MATALLGCIAAPTRAEDVSAPAMIQFFEARWETMDTRMVDVFYSGYGGLWLPPPGRGDTGGFSVGYDVFDRFDLGKPRNETLYGTETSLRASVAQAHRAGVNVFADLVLNHNGFGSRLDTGFVALGGYPGFAITLSGADIDGDFHDPTLGVNTDPLNGRLAGLIDVAQDKNHQLIRQPVAAGPNNVPAGTTYNKPAATNAHFYPDQDLGGTVVFDPELNQAATLYDFNAASPLSGDPMPENALGLLMRNARWMVQHIGVDGFRIDAVKHMPEFTLDYLDQAVYRANQRLNLDGSIKPVFSFAEVLDGNPAAVQGYIRKDLPNPLAIGPADTTVSGNRDALDFPLFFAMRDNLSGNGLANDWRNVKNASVDAADGYANNGSQGIAFVNSHDALPGGFPYLGDVAYAYTLMRPGNALVYFNAGEFGPDRDFPVDGRGDALGGQYGDAISRLVDVRNTHGRGNYLDRTPAGDEKEMLIYEREKSALVVLSNRLDAGFDSRTVQTSFAPGTYLIELTGNAANSTIDPTGNDFPELLQVQTDGTVNLHVARNRAPVSGLEHDKGYLIYGVAGPQGTLSLTNVESVFPAGTPTAATNGTTRLGSVDVIEQDAFLVRLETNAVNLLGNPAFRDRDADGDNALLKVDGGVAINATPGVDYVAPGSIVYGFEEFTGARGPGYFSPNGAGLYEQSIDATQLAEGYHFLTVRAFRHRDSATGGDGGPAVFTDFKRAFYIDRLPPESAIVSFSPFDSAPGTPQNRDLVARSVDQTADNMHMFLNLPAALTDQQILAMATAGIGDAGTYDRDQWVYGFFGVKSGNNVATIVTFEKTGNASVRRFPGLFVQTGLGAGLGDLNFDNVLSPNDLRASIGAHALEELLYSQNTRFSPAADVNADGRVDNRDLYALADVLPLAGANQATLDMFRAVLLHRGDLNASQTTDATDIDALYSRFGGTAWLDDLNVDGQVNQLDVVVLVETILGTTFGDLNLNGAVNGFDRIALLGHLGAMGLGWSAGDIDGNGLVDQLDFDLLLANMQVSGDVTADGFVDIFDVNQVSAHWGESGSQGDANGDGVVDIFDVNFASANWLPNGGAGALEMAVPEPSSGLLLVVGVATIAGHRRRRVAAARQSYSLWEH